MAEGHKWAHLWVQSEQNGSCSASKGLQIWPSSCSFVVHISKGPLASWGWGLFLWVWRWLVSPICAQKVLWQYGQGMVVAAGDLFALLSSPVCAVQLVLSCCLCRFLCPCEQVLATSLCLAQSAPNCQCWCWRPSMRLLVCLCSTFSGLLGSASLVAVCHRTVS